MQFSGVVGVFNCQGAGWYPEEHKCKAYPQCYKAMSGSVSSDAVEWEQKASTAEFRGADEFAVYLNKCDNLRLVKPKEQINITLLPSTFEIFTVSPVHKLRKGAKFAGIGLENMFNSGGAIEGMECGCIGGLCSVKMKVKGAGKFLAYSSEKPGEVVLNGGKVEYEWTSNGILSFEVPWTGGESSDVLILIH